MADKDREEATATAVKALHEAKPPASDPFTYLTLIEQHLSPEILPELNDILQDASLTQEIGWDLVDKLVAIPGSAQCLETIARSGNPREVILKVLETIEGLQDAFGDTDAPEFVDGFITLLGMLAILHKRIKTRYPSRFLANTLSTVLQTYLPSQEMTAAVLNLVRSLSTKKRPPLPTRSSSISVANPDQDEDSSKNQPDPEAETVSDPKELELQQRLLLSFVTCILESYVNVNEMAWAPRLLEYYTPEKIPPGKRTALAAFREDESLSSRDSVVGSLVGIAQDLGLPTATDAFAKECCTGKTYSNPLANVEHISESGDIALSTGGCLDIIAYWLFSSTVFDARNPTPDLHIFPDHLSLLQRFVSEDNAAAQIAANPGTIESVLTIGLYLNDHKLISAGAPTDFMAYHHILTLCAVFHPSLHTRNSATHLAGAILHADPDAQDRMKILEDLLENCDFASLKACAVSWLREELVSARKADQPSQQQQGNPFAGAEPIEQLQYAIFPDQSALRDQDTESLLAFWVENAPFLLQAANFAFFLFCSSTFRHVVPEGMGAAVEERWVTPLISSAAVLETVVSGPEAAPEAAGETVMQLSILQNTLKSLNMH